MSSLAALMAWLLPEQLPIAARITVFSLALAGGVYLSVWHGRRVLALTRESRVSDAMLPIVLGLFFIAYLAFMVLATSLEANLSLNTRYAFRSEEHTSELQSLMRISYAVFCLKKKTTTGNITQNISILHSD